MEITVNRELWRRLEPILDELLELPPEEVPAALDALETRDPELRSEAERWLVAEARAGTLLDTPAGELLALMLDPSDGDPDSENARHGHSPLDETRPSRVGERLGPYRLESLLGAGGMGEVYRAEDPRLGRTVAIKVLPQQFAGREARQRFEREARATAALDHPNLCTLHDLGETDDGRPYLVMAHYRGETLAERLERGPLGIEEALDIALQVTRALEVAHAAGVVHRDIKPANLMLAEGLGVKVLDFGVATLLGETALTRTGTSPGTPAYMSPEQIEGEGVGPATDLWSLGVVLWEMLAGSRPFRGQNAMGVLYAITHHPPDSLTTRRPEVAPELVAVVERMLEKDPAVRWGDATALRQALEALRRPDAVTGLGGRETKPSPRPPGSRRRWIAGLAVVLATLGIAGWLVPRMGRGPSISSPADDGAEDDRPTPPLTPFQLYRQGEELLTRYYLPDQELRAAESFRQALALDPDHAPALAGLALAHWRRYRRTRDRAYIEQAMGNAQRALEVAPQLSMAAVAMGLAELDDGHTETAKERFEELVRRDPDNADAHRGLGAALARLGDAAGAEAAYRRAVELRPDDPELHSLLGSRLYRRGDYLAAEAAYRQAVERAEDFQPGWKNLAASLHMQGRFAEASSALQRALEVSPEATIYNNLGTLYFFQGLFPQSVEAFEKAIELGANRSLIWANLGDARRRLPDSEEAAVQAYRTALALLREDTANPDDFDRRAFEAEIAAKAGETSTARALLTGLAPEGAEPRSLFNAAQAAEVLGQRDRALDWLGRALRAGYSAREVRLEPDFAELRQDPRFPPLLASAASGGP